METNKAYKQKLIKRAYKFSLDTIKLIDSLDKRAFSIQVIANQLIRSGTSIGANIVEAQAFSSKKDFTNFISHSLKSSNETRYWLGLLRDSGKAEIHEVGELLQEATELSKILGSSILSLRGKG
ncbi:MAG: hypothetical protein UU65_C0007G0004 [candidate division CPR2 bacterium GW2011_GWC1_41_48]|uniref:Four helix bundle protein n=1 Tax=candidate division CPR2 bacterium GW2011_GWC1_41_48 TaxID=1618344 RepID=A0A0G0Z6F5_UNCC2|nr:MAG: hypothetical protein UT47_C0008G0014 [candidate division CPR2 bacterium GW2011_GWC2_39_35]KKR27523.1 MAG: hypothetical protein UT60_C0046G0007 [candidate division CPR2 bacterium GW2011_GWD2_39_7]KKS08608.1 MAG: hypothetical protein UU65_C0007G0004 [candidate division CPR2 bacterium GW2011_GWC1_41_48]OGB71498.1 MAG: hypothetical protein A2Y26_05145 [candidate division CPR2 bacterium GWD2_39_7]